MAVEASCDCRLKGTCVQVVDVQNGIIVFVGLGSNLDNPLSRCREAIGYVAEIEGIDVLRRSSFFRTEPVGVRDQEWFINAVIEIRTILTPRELLAVLKEIEDRMGRKSPIRWGPRIIDLDILFYGQQVIQEKDIVIPHPELHRRRFVLEPLFELAPYFIHPSFGVSVRGLMERSEDPSRVELYEP
ncbi:MAG: 2-amino-4-hydroxy-6-hydroxymethyldihydropteridine diphosphokinase [Deltaproteobacteria bacterium]|nr:2-amino-4-hydroxy-6-hydroxymethyldihydropteridine diphosphokinase [Deltaproteobacteria bacterium]